MNDRERTDTALENWFLLMDPAWRPATTDEAPPVAAVVGLWPVEDGRLGRFRTNPDYQPTDENSPSDPLDAVLRLMLQGRAESTHVQLVLRDTLLDLAMHEDGRPLITKSPDDVPCVVAATAEPHRRRVNAPDWRRVDLEELVIHLADGVDILFNPAGPAPVRLTGDFIRDTLLLDDDEVLGVHTTATSDALRVIPWEA